MIQMNRIAKVLLLSLILLSLFSGPVSAEPLDLCEDADDAQTAMESGFLILAALGPVLGTFFYVMLTIASILSTGKDYNEEKRKVIKAGFGVPIVIAFLGAAANEIVPQVDISCFFPF